MSRLEQRVENFNRAFDLFEKTYQAHISSPDDEIYQLALAQSFEIVFELSWKVLKDYLKEQGVIAAYPKDVIKEAFNKETIQNGQLWIDMLEARNSTSHEYNIDKVNIILNKISSTYYEELKRFQNWIKEL